MPALDDVGGYIKKVVEQCGCRTEELEEGVGCGGRGGGVRDYSGMRESACPAFGAVKVRVCDVR